MNDHNEITKDYKQWIVEIKQRIRQCQLNVSVKANTELLHLYWDMGADIFERQKYAKWGDGFLKQMSQDLSKEFPEMKGFSYSNLRYIRQWYQFYNSCFQNCQQAVGKLEGCDDNPTIVAKQPTSQLGDSSRENPFPLSFFSIPWGHHIVIMQRCKDINKAVFYIQQTIENNWSRTMLSWQIDNKLFERQGKAISNFTQTLPAPQSDLAQQITKDPYIIDIMGIRQDMEERELEAHLNTHISQYLLELGKGFTYYGRQVHLVVDGDDFYIDQLFYHVKLHCYVVVELKAVKFKPEHIGQLNFYVAAVDSQMRGQHDNPTIGLLICKDKNDIVAEYSLRNIGTPIGVSSVQIYDQLTADYKSSLPTIEEIEEHLKET